MFNFVVILKIVNLPYVELKFELVWFKKSSKALRRWNFETRKAHHLILLCISSIPIKIVNLKSFPRDSKGLRNGRNPENSELGYVGGRG
jgi:hypothetical protein